MGHQSTLGNVLKFRNFSFGVDNSLPWPELEMVSLKKAS